MQSHQKTSEGGMRKGEMTVPCEAPVLSWPLFVQVTNSMFFDGYVSRFAPSVVKHPSSVLTALAAIPNALKSLKALFMSP